MIANHGVENIKTEKRVKRNERKFRKKQEIVKTTEKEITENAVAIDDLDTKIVKLLYNSD